MLDKVIMTERICWLAFGAAALAYGYYLYVSLYDICRSVCPGKAKLYLVLSILLPFLQPELLRRAPRKDPAAILQTSESAAKMV